MLLLKKRGLDEFFGSFGDLLDSMMGDSWKEGYNSGLFYNIDCALKSKSACLSYFLSMTEKSIDSSS